MQAVEKWKGGGGKAQRPDAGAVTARERIACGFHRHGHAILVPIAKRPLALGLTLERGIEPAVRLGNRLALQATPGNVGAECENALGHQPSLLWFLAASPLNTIEAGRAMVVCKAGPALAREPGGEPGRRGNRPPTLRCGVRICQAPPGSCGHPATAASACATGVMICRPRPANTRAPKPMAEPQ